MLDDLMLAERPAAFAVPARRRVAMRRPRTRLGRRLFGTRARRLQFLDALARSGDPAAAAAALSLSLVEAIRMRDEDALFANQWQAAMAIAWERVEHRLLADLLADGPGDEARVKAARDSKLALAILSRREPVVTRGSGIGPAARPVDSAHVAALRAELRALADPD